MIPGTQTTLLTTRPPQYPYLIILKFCILSFVAVTFGPPLVLAVLLGGAVADTGTIRTPEGGGHIHHSTLTS